MAAVALLHPQDAFNHLPAAIKSGRRFVNTATPGTSSPAGRRSPPSKRRKGSPTKKDAAPVNPKPRSTPKPTTPSGNTGNLVMGQVKILKRGETMPAPEKVNKVAENVIVSHKSFERVAPAKVSLVSNKSLEKAVPAKARKYINAFAGSAVTSPEPNCLPVPAFCSKKEDMSAVVDPTNNLLKLLRLNL